MEEQDVLKLWSNYNEKLEESLSVSRRNAEEISKLKIRSLISSMKPIKIFTLVAGLLWVGIGGFFLVILTLHGFAQVSKFFLFSAFIHVVLTGAAVVIYCYQLVLIRRVDVTKPVLETQDHLHKLKSTTLLIARILMLQLPVWTTFHLSEVILKNASSTFLIAQFIATATATYFAIWLFRNIKPENQNKKWFKLLFTGDEWTPILKSLNSIDELKAPG